MDLFIFFDSLNCRECARQTENVKWILITNKLVAFRTNFISTLARAHDAQKEVRGLIINVREQRANERAQETYEFHKDELLLKRH